MKRTLAFRAAGLAGAIITLLTLSLATGAFAQGSGSPPAQPTPGTGPYGSGQMMGRSQMGAGQSLVAMAAAEFGLTQAELVARLGSDGTIADALTAGDVDPAAFIERFVASRAERLDAAVAAGTITREDADARLSSARSMATARIYQPFTALGPSGQGQRQGAGFVDENGDGICDLMPAGDQMRGRMGGRGPRP